MNLSYSAYPPPSSSSPPKSLINLTQQLRLQNELPLFVLLAIFIRLIVFPSHCLFALPAADIPNDMAPRCHVALIGFAVDDVDDFAEEVGFAVLAAEVLVVGQRGQQDGVLSGNEWFFGEVDLAARRGARSLRRSC